MKVPLLVIGGGLSGLAAAIRAARFSPEVLLVEKHSRLGGLNSYFFRDKILFETGLHAITNYAEPENKKAPLNRLLRQLKLPRKDLPFCQQLQSEIVFRDCQSLLFSNDFELFRTEIASKFPTAAAQFDRLLQFLDTFDPFSPAPFRSTRKFLTEVIPDPLLIEMILCPLMYYGSSHEQDMDLSQFAIMFRAIFQEGMFRPRGTMKDFLELLDAHYQNLGGTRRLGCGVKNIMVQQNRALGVELESGEIIECDHMVSTIGHAETLRLIAGQRVVEEKTSRLGFIESIIHLKDPVPSLSPLPADRTIIFFNNGARFNYASPDKLVDFTSGVICFPANFRGLPAKAVREIRSTHLANASEWQKKLATSPAEYTRQKQAAAQRSVQLLENIIGSFSANIVYVDTFTPVTIERYTSKIGGAIYGSPNKIKDGNIGFANLFLAGTDQGFLGIIGSMLSGVSIVNQHILPKL